MKSYIPPKERTFFTRTPSSARLSFLGIFVTFCLFLSTVSLISLFQSNLGSVQAKVIERKNNPSEITDAVTGSNIVVNNSAINKPNLTNLALMLNNLPLERVWPLRGRITTYYSYFHPALDIAAGYNTPIHPFASGIVIVSKFVGGGFGRYIVIRHNDGYESTYAHLNSSTVVLGQQVRPSDVIGTVGSTGYATGPHLHFQLTKEAKTFNPLQALP